MNDFLDTVEIEISEELHDKLTERAEQTGTTPCAIAEQALVVEGDAYWAEVLAKDEAEWAHRCYACGGELTPCTCRPDCPGGECKPCMGREGFTEEQRAEQRELLRQAFCPEGRDLGADRDTRPPKACLRRFASGRWCTREDSHQGDCDGPPAREYPVNDLGPKRRMGWG